MDEKLKKVAGEFALQGEPVELIKYGEGHINDTYRIKCVEHGGKTNKYILQKINTTIFKEPVNLIENVFNVTNHIRGKIEELGGDVMKETLNLVEAKNGKCYFIEEDGGFYRVYNFIEGARTFQVVENREDFYKSGQALGRFQKHLSDFESRKLHETIKDFHNTEKRFADFKESLKEDKFHRAEECHEEVDFFLKREEDTKVINRLIGEGKLPIRVTHNDTKFNNVMIDDVTREAICLLDLDTVMPGVSLYDFGDSIRSGATTAEEDEIDLSKVNFDLGLFEAYTQGLGFPLCGGGRYDKMLKTFGNDCPATGFALGIERIMLALERQKINYKVIDKNIYVAWSEGKLGEAILKAKSLRAEGLTVEIGFTSQTEAEAKCYQELKKYQTLVYVS